jgi:hypothetical protein
MRRRLFRGALAAAAIIGVLIFPSFGTRADLLTNTFLGSFGSTALKKFLDGPDLSLETKNKLDILIGLQPGLLDSLNSIADKFSPDQLLEFAKGLNNLFKSDLTVLANVADDFIAKESARIECLASNLPSDAISGKDAHSGDADRLQDEEKEEVSSLKTGSTSKEIATAYQRVLAKANNVLCSSALDASTRQLIERQTHDLRQRFSLWLDLDCPSPSACFQKRHNILFGKFNTDKAISDLVHVDDTLRFITEPLPTKCAFSSSCRVDIIPYELALFRLTRLDLDFEVAKRAQTIDAALRDVERDYVGAVRFLGAAHALTLDGSPIALRRACTSLQNANESGTDAIGRLRDIVEIEATPNDQFKMLAKWLRDAAQEIKTRSADIRNLKVSCSIKGQIDPNGDVINLRL